MWRSWRTHSGRLLTIRAYPATISGVATGLVIGRHPDDPELRVLSMTKTNVGPPGASLGFRLVRPEGGGQTVVDWAGPLDVTADDLLGGGTPARAGRQSRQRATEWLRTALADGPQRVADLQAGAAVAGIAWRTLERVKESLGVRSEAVRQGKRTEWVWRDPAAEASAFGELPPLEPLGWLGS